MPGQNDGERIPLPADEGPFFAGYAAEIAALNPADLEAELAERRKDFQAAADAGNANRSRRAAISLSIAKDEFDRRSPAATEEMNTGLRRRHETALTAIRDDDTKLGDVIDAGPTDPGDRH